MIFADSTGRSEFVVSAARQNGRCLLVHDLALICPACVFVVTFDQEPLLLLLPRARPHAHEVPPPFEPFPAKREIEMALGIALSWIAVRLPASLVPDDHRAAAVFAFWDYTFEGQ